MRMKCLVLISSVLFAGLLVIGCGQSSNPQVSINSGQPSGYSIHGTVLGGGIDFNRFNYNTNAYTIINTKPLEKTSVILSGANEEKIETDAKGQYSFSNLKPGSYTITVSKEGYQTKKIEVAFDASAPDNTSLTADIEIADNPLLISVAFDNNTSPEAVVIVFNEPMDITTVLASLNYGGMRTANVSASGAISLDKSWDKDNTVLTLKPRGGFIPGANYNISIYGSTGNYADIKDVAKNSLDPGVFKSSSYYSSIIVNLGTPYNGSVPQSSPANLKTASTVDYANCIDGKKITFSWDAVAGATSYNLYCSYNGGPFQICQKGIINNNAFLTAEEVDNALADYSKIGSWCPTEVNGVIQWPFIGDKGIDFKVTAVNPAGESGFSDVLNVKDNIKPWICYARRPYYYSSTEVEVYFNEPLDKTSAANLSNYTISGQTITVFAFQNNYSNPSGTHAYLVISPGINNGTVEVSSNIKDLSGNEINPSQNKALIQ